MSKIDEETWEIIDFFYLELENNLKDKYPDSEIQNKGRQHGVNMHLDFSPNPIRIYVDKQMMITVVSPSGSKSLISLVDPDSFDDMFERIHARIAELFANARPQTVGDALKTLGKMKQWIGVNFIDKEDK